MKNIQNNFTKETFQQQAIQDEPKGTPQQQKIPDST